MNKNLVKKGLIVGIVWLVVGVSAFSATGTQQNLKEVNAYNMNLPFLKKILSEKNGVGTLDHFSSNEHPQMQQMLNNGLGLYFITSTSGTGRAIHFLLKIHKLIFGGMIIYLSLTAMTIVWKLTNMTKLEVIDTAIGPHVIVFFGLFHGEFKRNILKGSGNMVGVSIIKPLLIP